MEHDHPVPCHGKEEWTVGGAPGVVTAQGPDDAGFEIGSGVKQRGSAWRMRMHSFRGPGHEKIFKSEGGQQALRGKGLRLRDLPLQKDRFFPSPDGFLEMFLKSSVFFCREHHARHVSKSRQGYRP